MQMNDVHEIVATIALIAVGYCILTVTFLLLDILPFWNPLAVLSLRHTHQ